MKLKTVPLVKIVLVCPDLYVIIKQSQSFVKVCPSTKLLEHIQAKTILIENIKIFRLNINLCYCKIELL